MKELYGRMNGLECRLEKEVKSRSILEKEIEKLREICIRKDSECKEIIKENEAIKEQVASQDRKIVELEFRIEERSVESDVCKNESNVGRETEKDGGINDESKIVRVNKVGKGETGAAMKDGHRENKGIEQEEMRGDAEVGISDREYLKSLSDNLKSEEYEFEMEERKHRRKNIVVIEGRR